MHNQDNEPLDPTAQEAAQAWTTALGYIRRTRYANVFSEVLNELKAQRLDDRGYLVLRCDLSLEFLGPLRPQLEDLVQKSGAAPGLVLTDTGPGLSVKPNPLPRAPLAGRGLQSAGNILGAATGLALDGSDAQAEIALSGPKTAGEIAYIHSVFTQMFLPRSQPRDERGRFTREWVRKAGRLSLTLTAGRIVRDGHKRDILLPLPYGVKPRLMLIDVCTQAIRNQSPVVHMEASARKYLQRLGLQAPSGSSGRQYTLFRDQALALSACRLAWQWDGDDSIHFYDGTPLKDFRVWRDDGRQMAFWPGSIRLDTEFFASLRQRGLPLDLRAVRALKASALALDWYVFFAQRLRRIKPDESADLSWKVLRDAMGQEYATAKDFKRWSVKAIKKAMAVYPGLSHAVESVPGGVRLSHCQPPINERKFLGERQ